MIPGVVAGALNELVAPTSIVDVGASFHDWHPVELAYCLDPSSFAPDGLVGHLTTYADVVAFACGENDHISKWASLFKRRGYRAYDLVRVPLWWNQRVPWRIRQSLMVFASDEVAEARGWSPTPAVDLAQPALLMPELDKQLDATVCIPWRPSPSRMAAFERVQAYWAQFGWPVVTADSDTEVFSLPQARNNAVRQAGTSVVVISDADTLVDPLNVVRAVAEPSGVCWPFTRYRTIDSQYLALPLEELAAVPSTYAWDGDGVQGVGGCMVTTTAEYWRLGGQPEEFIGWGWEDTAFTCVVRTLSMPKRAAGNLYAFEHNTEAEQYVAAKADSPGWDRDVDRNRHLMAPYLNADQVPWKMRALLKQRRVEAERSTL